MSALRTNSADCKRQFDMDPIAYAQRDIELGHERFRDVPFVPGGKRGVDVYRSEALPAIYVQALRNFLNSHGRLPDLDTLNQPGDHLFASKFFRYFPIEPNPAAKHNATRFVPEHLRHLLAEPQRRVFFTANDLRRVEISGDKPFFLKISLGNANHIKITPDRFRAEIDDIVAEFERRMAEPRYGLAWGEWVYGVGPQAILVEQDVTPAFTGHEYQFFVRAGRVRVFRVQDGLAWPDDGSERVIKVEYYYRSGALCPGTIYNRMPLDLPQLSDQLDAMIQLAEGIGTHFDTVRVDFLETRRGPVLGELTLFPGNARGHPSTEDLCSVLIDAYRMLPEPTVAAMSAD